MVAWWLFAVLFVAVTLLDWLLALAGLGRLRLLLYLSSFCCVASLAGLGRLRWRCLYFYVAGMVGLGRLAGCYYIIFFFRLLTVGGVEFRR